ncbi:MORN-repeat protein [Orpheovirus IHUMI-LCC2]|uniref:MORN-repeat protein n=1 Tax=Orpheovirus IHUMI-LCC2 TaxID=2023057 RepID=A0A2I2L4R6_9VIRU|nr:MORN-repeat protein [Orpheovirus IHUMI-LCC2]SNW62517.1 MORN-repeat protein [Orpheovirus IHUMI-LCC2]
MESLSDDILFYNICYSNYDVALIFNRLCKRFNKLSKGYGNDKRNIKEYFLECCSRQMGDIIVNMWYIKLTENVRIIEKYSNNNLIIEREIITYIDNNKNFHKYDSWHNNGNKHCQYSYHITKDKWGYKLKDYEGDHNMWYENGNKYQECYYVNGIKEGRQIKWYENGNKKENCTYKNGDLNEKYEFWHENGVKAINCYYNNGKLNGEYKSWYANKNKKTYCRYINDTIYGKYKSWYFSGNKLERFTVNDGGHFDGKYQLWYENGGKNEKCIYKDGKYHGLYKSWYESTYKNKKTGQERIIRYYKNGNKTKTILKQ